MYLIDRFNCFFFKQSFSEIQVSWLLKRIFTDKDSSRLCVCVCVCEVSVCEYSHVSVSCRNLLIYMCVTAGLCRWSRMRWSSNTSNCQEWRLMKFKCVCEICSAGDSPLSNLWGKEPLKTGRFWIWMDFDSILIIFGHWHHTYECLLDAKYHSTCHLFYRKKHNENMQQTGLKWSNRSSVESEDLCHFERCECDLSGLFSSLTSLSRVGICESAGVFSACMKNHIK